MKNLVLKLEPMIILPEQVTCGPCKFNTIYCQALVQVRVLAPVPSRIKVPQKRKKEGFGPRADTKILYSILKIS